MPLDIKDVLTLMISFGMLIALMMSEKSNKK
ncbi:putative holin-like toxin [Virgibacillus kekensis]|uniref:Holin-like toxin n=1 Tax=Virgibacillus kekensis TaxID=202261 RepID=A0ABV9DKZ3_9BACI